MTSPIQLINNGTTASSWADCADGDYYIDWESHPLLAGFDEEAVARAAEAPSELPGVLLAASHKETEARAAEAQMPGTACGFFVGEVFCAWALSELPCAAWESGFFVGEEFCAWTEWANMRPSQEQEAARQREQEAAQQREQEAARQREQDAARQREQEKARQLEQEAAQQREQEAARQREQEAARQREPEKARQREQEAARHVRALGLAQPKPEPLHADTEWTETASVASSRTTVRHATRRTVVCIICGQVGHDANTGCTKGLKGLCFRCNRPGHVAAKCPQARLAEERRWLERGCQCYACGQPGHFARDCRISASAQRF